MAGRISYYGNIVKDGLVLNLDAAKRDSYPGTGTAWNDISGNGNNGTLNGPIFNSENGGSIIFDGSNDYVQVSNNSTLNSTSGTINIWFKYLLVTGVNNFASLIAKHDPGNSFNGYVIFIQPNGSIGVQIKGAGPTTNISGPSSYQSDLWHNITLTYVSGVSHALYSNGVLFSSGGCVSFSISSQPLRIVDSVDAFWGILSGNVSQVQIYNRALSAAEVLQNYNATKNRYI
jgi:hypothetical protein